MISTKRRDEHEPSTDDVFDAFPDRGGEPKVDPNKTTEGPSIAELMERLGSMQARLDAAEQDRAMADTVRTAPPPAQTQAPALNLENLPDPVTDPKGYAATIAQRTLAYQSDLERFHKGSQPAALGDPDAIWEDFQDQYPDYAQDNNRIRFATGEVASRLAKRGVDVQKFMYTKTGQMFKMIADEYDKTFGSPVEEAEIEEEEAPAPRRRRKELAIDDDGDDGRAASVLGAGDSPGTPRAPSGKPAPGLIEDLQAIQRKTGYF